MVEGNGRHTALDGKTCTDEEMYEVDRNEIALARQCGGPDQGMPSIIDADRVLTVKEED